MAKRSKTTATKSAPQPIESEPSLIGLRTLIQENLALTRQVQTAVKKINRYLAWQRTWGLVKVLIITIAVILGFAFLPTLFKDVMSQYQEMLSSGNPGLLEQLRDELR